MVATDWGIGISTGGERKRTREYERDELLHRPEHTALWMLAQASAQAPLCDQRSMLVMTTYPDSVCVSQTIAPSP
jgi:hypothetical protein